MGFDNAAILDGGFQNWAAEGRPISTDAIQRSAKHLSPKPRPELIAYRDEVLASINDNSVSLIDTMPEEFFSGEMTLYQRTGHIPGASNTSGLKLIDKTGHFRSDEELAAMHKGDRNLRTITYCGGGIMASSNAFVMTRLGFTDVAVYTASLQEWAADPTNPMVVDIDI